MDVGDGADAATGTVRPVGWLLEDAAAKKDKSIKALRSL
jgi:hypothetical protein